MERTEYDNLVLFIKSNCCDYPTDLSDTKTKSGINKRHSYKNRSKTYFVNDDVLYRNFKGKLKGVEVVPAERCIDILKEFHGSALGGHTGVNKTTSAIQLRYWWFGLTDDVKNYVRSCERCQKSDPFKPPQKPELQSIKVSHPFELVGIDLTGPLTETDDGNKYIFTATDYFTKWVEAFPIPSKSANDVVSCIKKMISRHGAMNAILTDQGREFLNQVNSKLCEEWNIKHKVTAAYHPQTNGLDERTNQTLKTALRKLTNENQTDWDQCLDSVLFALRTKPQCSTKFSPFFLLYGREAVYPSSLPKDFGDHDSFPEEPSTSVIDAFLDLRSAVRPVIYKAVTDNQDAAHQRQKKSYEKTHSKRKYVNFGVGDNVLLYNSRNAARKGKTDLHAKYDGPYSIMQIDGKTAKLKNKNGMFLKKSYNVDRLKLFNQGTLTEDVTTKHQQTEILNPVNSLQDANLSTNNVEQRDAEVSPTPELPTTMSPINCPQKTDSAASVYVSSLLKEGTLHEVINILQRSRMPKPQSINQHRLLAKTCPVFSFVTEVSKDEQQLDAFTAELFPYIRAIEGSNSEKTDCIMLLACMCMQSFAAMAPVTVMSQTLRMTPQHLIELSKDPPPLAKGLRIAIGGETIEAVDLATLNGNNWLNDKVVNAFLSLLKKEKNITETHVFVLPSYTAVMWSTGELEHHMFKKVRFSYYKYVLLPAIVRGNHWLLLVADVKNHSVSIFDSRNGPDGMVFVQAWQDFMKIREQIIPEGFGDWSYTTTTSNQQTDGDSCGVFTLMNAEAIIKDVPHQVMRQVHVPAYRQYVKKCLLTFGSVFDERHCDMPECTSRTSGHKRWVQCSVCGRWFHISCCRLPLRAAINDEDFECVYCTVMYS